MLAAEVSLQAASDRWQAVIAAGLVNTEQTGSPLPGWADLSRELTSAGGDFNAMAAQYNDAIGQFPARLLAWLFGLEPAMLHRTPA